MRVVCLSDIHGNHWRITDFNPIPDGDVLVVTGDWQSYGRDHELFDFNKWLGTLPHKHKLVVAGNHDRTAFVYPIEEVKQGFSNATYLQDEEVVIEGVKFYGSPWTPEFCGWHFMMDRGSFGLRQKWAQIPEDTDVLLTHGPPMHKLDWAHYSKEYAGCEDLRNRVDVVKPRFHVFGHIHAGYGGIRNEHTQFINASTCNERYVPVNKPVCFGIRACDPRG